jgi:hypothetical protein
MALKLGRRIREGYSLRKGKGREQFELTNGSIYEWFRSSDSVTHDDLDRLMGWLRARGRHLSLARVDARTICRRAERDRRSWQPMPQVPFKDSGGYVVVRDRRQTPERRVNDIDVEWF